MMARFLPVALLAAVSLSGGVAITRTEGRVHIEIDGKPFTDLRYGGDAPKPYLHPLRAASGTVVTRGFPMERIPGETTTDQHQRAVWLGYSSVNGFDFWKNEFSYGDPQAGRVEVVGLKVRKDSVRGVFRWLTPSGQPLLEETRTMSFSGTKALRIVDVDLTLRALSDTTFGDSKDGAFGIRLAEPLTEKNGGVITNSAGARGMKQAWGARASWVDYSGEIQGEKVGVALFDHPLSFGHPARWHVRDYGLLAVNPWGSHAFDDKLPETASLLKTGESLRLKYRIVIHGAMEPGELDRMYKQFAGAR